MGRTMKMLMILLLLAAATAPGREYRVKQVQVVTDGDTIVRDLDLGFGVTLSSQALRIVGIDAPELRPRLNVPNREAEIAAAKAAKAQLAKLLDGRRLVVRTRDDDERDNFGRILGALYIVNADGSRTSVAMLMYASGHVRAYGDTTEL